MFEHLPNVSGITLAFHSSWGNSPSSWFSLWLPSYRLASHIHVCMSFATPHRKQTLVIYRIVVYKLDCSCNSRSQSEFNDTQEVMILLKNRSEAAKLALRAYSKPRGCCPSNLYLRHAWWCFALWDWSWWAQISNGSLKRPAWAGRLKKAAVDWGPTFFEGLTLVWGLNSLDVFALVTWRIWYLYSN